MRVRVWVWVPWSFRRKYHRGAANNVSAIIVCDADRKKREPERDMGGGWAAVSKAWMGDDCSLPFLVLLPWGNRAFSNSVHAETAWRLGRPQSPAQKCPPPPPPPCTTPPPPSPPLLCQPRKSVGEIFECENRMREKRDRERVTAHTHTHTPITDCMAPLPSIAHAPSEYYRATWVVVFGPAGSEPKLKASRR